MYPEYLQKILNDADKYFEAANKSAQQFSPDPNVKVGVCLVNDSGFYVTSCNDIPDGVNKSANRLVRPEKYYWIEHAERNVIYQTVKLGISCDHYSFMFFSTAPTPCADCVRAIIQSGIKYLVGKKDNVKEFGDHWKETIERGRIMLLEAGVETIVL